MIPPGSATVIHGLYIIRFPFGTLSKREGGLPGKGGRLVESFPGGTSICGPSESGRSPLRLVPARSTSAIQSARVGMRPPRFRAAWLVCRRCFCDDVPFVVIDFVCLKAVARSRRGTGRTCAQEGLQDATRTEDAVRVGAVYQGGNP